MVNRLATHGAGSHGHTAADQESVETATQPIEQNQANDLSNNSLAAADLLAPADDTHDSRGKPSRGALSQRRRHENSRSAQRLGLVAVLVIVASIAFMLIGTSHPLLVFKFRFPKLAALILVGWATAVATVLFQTITGNRILTPSIMGFDALYTLLQTCFVMLLGVAGLSTMPDLVEFGLTLVIMVAVSLGLFMVLFRGRRSVTTLVLVGVIMGTFLRSITTFIQRMLDPSTYLVLQQRLFASFNVVDQRLLGISAVIVVAVSLVATRYLRDLDVLALGQDTATSLGVDHRRLTRTVLVLVTILVSVSTALVGPIMFFGLLVAHLAYWAAGSHRHAITVPMAALLAMLVLIGGQTILNQLLHNETVLSVVIDLLGGITLLVLLVRSGRHS